MMSTPYFCTKCSRQHVRGKVYEEHKDFSKEIAAKIAEIVEGERKALAFELQPEIDAAALPADIIPLPKLTEIRDGEVVNTPAYREPRLKPDAPDVLWDDRTAEYENRAPSPNMVYPHPGPTVQSGQVSKHPQAKITRHREHWWQFWRPRA